MAYKLAFPPRFSIVHLVIHVSMLQKYVPDESDVILLDSVLLGPDLSFEEDPTANMDRNI